jgi:hypothetical protein
MKPFAIKPVTPEQLFTNRERMIDHFYDSALNAIHGRTISTVLLGHRRMGKSEVFKRVVNRLFFEQDLTQSVCIPVYYEFQDTFSNANDFAIAYVINFLRWYTAFLLQDPTILDHPTNTHQLIQLADKNLPKTFGLKVTLSLLGELLQQKIPIPEQQALRLPSVVANRDDITIAVFLDEFQNTRLPQYNLDFVGHFKEPVESINSPHFITGSAMRVLSEDILGKGALYGRFDFEHILPLTPYYSRELILKLEKYYNMKIHEDTIEMIIEKCGGNPFYITATIRQAYKQKKHILNETDLDALMALEICSGFIWGELADQVNRWIQRINKKHITKWILYLSAFNETDEIDIQSIRKQLKQKENIDVNETEIKEILVKLSRGDLLEYKAFGDWFGKIKDPILNEFLKVWGQIEIERQQVAYVTEEKLKQFQTHQKQFNNYKGYVAEIFIAQIFWNCQGQLLPAQYFHCEQDIQVSHHFIYVDQRYRKTSGKNVEIDICASSIDDIWLVESKNWQKAVGPDIIKNLIAQKNIVKQNDPSDQRPIVLWLFAKNGLTESALQLAMQHNVLWSSLNDLNALLEIAKLKKLPGI